MKQLVDVLNINETKDTPYNRTALSNEIENPKDKSTLVNTWEKKVNKMDPEEEMYYGGVTEWRF